MNGQSNRNEVILGVDTHLDVHLGAVINHTGQILGVRSVATNAAGYRELLIWAQSFGALKRAGVEGTGTYGAGLARVLHEHDVVVYEVNRPDRSRRRLQGKSDPLDAENAARAVLAGQATAIPKVHSGVAEALRIATIARRSAVKAKTQTMNQIRAILVSAPDDIRRRLWRSKPQACALACSRLRSLGETVHLQMLNKTLRTLGKRWCFLADEVEEHDRLLEALTAQHAKHLRQQYGVGPQTAAVLLSVAGDNPERIKSEAALAALCGTNPLPASSGKTIRHRLNRGGSRMANNALWTIAMVRMRSEGRTKAYVARRVSEGLSTEEIQRCLKRYIVRELYPLIMADLSASARIT